MITKRLSARASIPVDDTRKTAKLVSFVPYVVADKGISYNMLGSLVSIHHLRVASIAELGRAVISYVWPVRQPIDIYTPV